MKIRIAYVIPQLNFGGGQTMLARLIKNIDKERFEVCLFVLKKRLNNSIEEDIISTGINCVFLGIDDECKGVKKAIRKARGVFQFFREIRKFNPEIVHDHLDNFYSFIYCIICRTKMIFTIHSWPDRLDFKRMKFYINCLNKRKCLRLIGVSNAVSTRTKEVLLNDTCSVVTIYNPIEIDMYKHEYNRGEHCFQYIHIGRLTSIKNQKLLLRAFEIVCREKNESKLWIVGDGELHDELVEYAQKLSIISNVEFLGNRSDIPELLSKSDAFVLSSFSEACPMTVLEAMASHVPVISTNVGSIEEQVGSNYLLCKSDDPNMLAEKMLLVQCDDGLVNRAIKIQNQRLQAFSIEKTVEQHEELYITFINR